MCRSLVTHRPQKVEIGTVLGLSPSDARSGYARTVGTARRVRLTISAPPWRNVERRCERVSLRSRRGMGRRTQPLVAAPIRTKKGPKITPLLPLHLLVSLAASLQRPSDLISVRCPWPSSFSPSPSTTLRSPSITSWLVRYLIRARGFGCMPSQN